MEPYSLQVIANCRMAEDQQAAARDGLADEADRVRRQARRAEGSSLDWVRRLFARMFGIGFPSGETPALGRHA